METEILGVLGLLANVLWGCVGGFWVEKPYLCSQFDEQDGITL